MSEIVPEKMLEDSMKKLNNESASKITQKLCALIGDIEQGKKVSEENIVVAENVIESKLYSEENKKKAKFILKHTKEAKKNGK